MQTIFGISKSTVEGTLAALLALSGPLSGFLAAWQAIQSQIPGHGPANYTLAIAGAVLTCVFAVLRAWIGLLTNDALTPAQTGQIAIASVRSGVPPVTAPTINTSSVVPK